METTTVRDLEGAMRDCKHGGPTEEEQREPWSFAAALYGQSPIPMINFLHRNSTEDDIVKTLQQAEDIISGND